MSKSTRKERRALQLQAQRNRKKEVRAAVRRLVPQGHPALETVCDSVDINGDLSWVQDLKVVCMATPDGVGLAAPQIGITKRAIYVNPRRHTNGEGWLMLNPVITQRSEKMVSGLERCLSYPGSECGIMRPEWVTLQWIDPATLMQKEETFQRFTARVACHELEHLDGICLVRDYRKGRRDDFVYDPSQHTVSAIESAAIQKPDFESDESNLQPRRSRSRASMSVIGALLGLSIMGLSTRPTRENKEWDS